MRSTCARSWGPSAILLALMASGLDGQRFAFNGYLPTDPSARVVAIREAEKRSAHLGQTQIFIETPYRNRALFGALIDVCKPTTDLCIACDLTVATQSIAMRTIAAWRQATPDLDKRPAIFLLLAN